MSTHTIQNEFLSVSAADHGAELQSICSRQGTEYLWQGDGTYWTDRAPNLFPYVGRLTRGRYTLDGREYAMDIHGLALYRDFLPVAQSRNAMTFRLESSRDTLAHYPRQFRFDITYRLEGPSLQILFRVENRDEKTMYFGLGGHPGFRVPLENGRAFEDYRLDFGGECAPIRVGFTEACFLNGDDRPFPLKEGRYLPLGHDLFDQDAIVLRDMPREVTLACPAGGPGVTVAYPGMPYLGIWHMPRTDAPYVCIEPWCSLPSRQDRVEALEEQADLLRLAPGEVCENTWTITIHE